MKNIYIYFLLFFTFAANAQSPQGISYQAVARDSTGKILSNQPIKIKFSIRDSVANGTIVYQETHADTTDALGLFDLVIGNGTSTSGTFAGINWGNNKKYMQVEFDANVGSYTNLGTQQMMSVPYALHSKTSESIVNSNGVPIGGAILPTILTSEVTNIDCFTASSGGLLLNEGGSKIIAKGVCWSIYPNPSINDDHSIDTGWTSYGTGPEFNSLAVGLKVDTLYYLRAYATNAVGTSYGKTYTFISRSIGCSYQGGLIGYILKNGDPGYDSAHKHGLILTPYDLSTSCEWGCYGTDINGADGLVIGTGEQNTADILKGCKTKNIAANLCDTLTLNNYTDWYLPSRNEFSTIAQNYLQINGFKGSYYWTSSEERTNYSWYIAFDQSVSSYMWRSEYKSNLFSVRAIRKF
jgi:hypothetical protein